jgi:hypothetical protein
MCDHWIVGELVGLTQEKQNQGTIALHNEQ